MDLKPFMRQARYAASQWYAERRFQLNFSTLHKVYVFIIEWSYKILTLFIFSANNIYISYNTCTCLFELMKLALLYKKNLRYAL